MRKAPFVCQSIVIIFATLIANAQPRNIRWGVSPNIGVSRLLGGDAGSTLRPSFGFELSYFALKNLSIAYNASYKVVTPRKGDSYLESDPQLDFKTFLLPQSLDITLFLPQQKSFIPFISAGAGLLIWDVRESTKGSFFENGFFYGNSIHDGSNINTILELTIGAERPLGDHLTLAGYFNLTHIFDQRMDNIGNNDINTKISDVGIKLLYYFTGPKDTDQDGIVDEMDMAPLIAEDIDGYEDDDGIPDPDNDEDGVIDELDKAPLIAEDIDGFEDDDGVPDLDNDWDGIPDIEDGAPNEPEDFDDYQDNDGIPDTDNDNDGVPDLVDLCKDKAENHNGYRDDDGCPDEKPAPIVEKGQRVVLEGINFELDSAELTRDSYPVLETVFESLYANPEIRVEIRGYTDSTGSEEYNQKLSKARAEKVRDYLLEKGIDSYRIEAEGYGSKNPIATNATEQGRAKNRRIEFYRLD